MSEAPTLFELTYVRYDVHGRLHTERGGTPFGTYYTYEEAFERYKQVLNDDYPTGGVVTILQTVMDAYWHQALEAHIVHEGRR